MADFMQALQLGQRSVPTLQQLSEFEQQRQSTDLLHQARSIAIDNAQRQQARQKKIDDYTNQAYEAATKRREELKSSGLKPGERKFQQEMMTHVNNTIDSMPPQVQAALQSYREVWNSGDLRAAEQERQNGITKLREMIAQAPRDQNGNIEGQAAQSIILMSNVLQPDKMATVAGQLSEAQINSQKVANAAAKAAKDGRPKNVYPTGAALDMATEELTRAVESRDMEFENEDHARDAAFKLQSIAQDMWARNPVGKDGQPMFTNPEQARQKAMDYMFERGFLYVEGKEGEPMSLNRLQNISDKAYYDPDVRFNPNPEPLRKQQEGEKGGSDTQDTTGNAGAPEEAPMASQASFGGVPDPYDGQSMMEPPGPPAGGPAPRVPPQEGPPIPAGIQNAQVGLDPNRPPPIQARPGWGDPLSANRPTEPPPPIPADRPPAVGTASPPGTAMTSPASPPAPPVTPIPLGREEQGPVARDAYMDSFMSIRGEGIKDPKARKEWLDSFYATRGPGNDPTDPAAVPEPVFTADEPSPRLLNLIEEFEGFREDAYKDSTGKWTIGFGTTAGVRPGDKMSRQEARNRVKKHLQIQEKRIDGAFPGLTLNQKEAVMDLVYNIGYARFKKSKAYTALKKGDLATFVYEAFDPQQGFVKAGGKILKGLQRRRLAEMQLFMSE